MSGPGPEPQPTWLDGLATIPPAFRPNVITMSRQAERAVTEPQDPGAWSSPWRLAVAARIATQNGLPAMAARYRARVQDGPDAAVAEPGFPGRDGRETVVLAFMDKVAREPRAIVAEDIDRLREAAIGEPDIVRLCELNAFLSYQCRVAAGLRAMGWSTP